MSKIKFYYLTEEHEDLGENSVVISKSVPGGENLEVFSLGCPNDSINVPGDKLEALDSSSLGDIGKNDFLLKLVQHNSTELLDIAKEENLIGIDKYEGGNSILHLAIQEKKPEMVSHLLFNIIPHFDKKTQNSEGETILHMAVKAKDKEIIEVLFKDIVNTQGESDDKTTEGDEGSKNDLLELKDTNKNTALHLACEVDFCLAITKLVELNADTLVKNKKGDTPLHLAASLKDSQSVKTLRTAIKKLEGGAAQWKKIIIEKNNDKLIPVMLADNSDSIKLLLENAILTARVSEEHGPILHWACGNNKVKIVEEALSIGSIDINKTNHKAFTPLKIACKRAYDEAAELLLKAGADPDYIGKSVGFTALNNAAQYGHLNTVKLLIKYGASIAKSCMVNTALNSAVYGGQAKITRYLLSEHNVDPNIVNRAGKTPMFQGINEGHPDCVKVLIEFGADVNSVIDPTGDMRPIHLAVRMERRQILKFLLDNGAKPDEVTDKGVTALMLTAEKDCGSFIPLLMSHGITLTKLDDEKNTIIHYIAKNGALRCAEYLMQRISKLSGVTQQYQIYKNKNSENMTPFDIACKEKREDVLAIFIKYAPDDFFANSPKILHEMYDRNMDKTLIAVLNSFIETDEDGTVTIQVKIFDSNDHGEKGQYPEVKNYKHMAPSLLHKIHQSENNDLKYHPLVTAIVAEKLFIYRSWYIFSFLIYLIFLCFLFFSLIRASYLCDEMLFLYNEPWDYFRAFSEIISILFWILFVVDECIEFVIECYQLRFEQPPQNPDEDKSEDFVKVIHDRRSIVSFTYKIFRFSSTFRKIDKMLLFVPTGAINYITGFNIVDFSGLLCFLIFVITRVAMSRYQWTFAAFTFILFSLRLFKYTRIIPGLGAYVNSVFRIFVIDIPRFSVIIIIILLAYIGGIHLAARQQIFPVGEAFSYSSGATCQNTTTSILWFDDMRNANYDLLRPIISGFIFLLDGGPGNVEDSLFSINFLFTALYLAFAFAIIVVMSNILIAQLSETYSVIVKTNELFYKMELIVNLELKSNLSFIAAKCFQKYMTIESITFPPDRWKEIKDASPAKNNEVQISEMRQQMNETIRILDSEASKSVINQEWIQEHMVEIFENIARQQTESLPKQATKEGESVTSSEGSPLINVRITSLEKKIDAVTKQVSEILTLLKKST